MPNQTGYDITEPLSVDQWDCEAHDQPVAGCDFCEVFALARALPERLKNELWADVEGDLDDLLGVYLWAIDKVHPIYPKDRDERCKPLLDRVVRAVGDRYFADYQQRPEDEEVDHA